MHAQPPWSASPDELAWMDAELAGRGVGMTTTITAEMVTAARRSSHDAAVAEARATGDRSVSREEKQRLRRESDHTWHEYQRLQRAYEKQEATDD